MVILHKLSHNMLRPLSINTILLACVMLVGCQLPASINNEQMQIEASTSQETIDSRPHDSQIPLSTDGHRNESDQPSPIALDPSKGQEIGTIFEAFLSPHQEGGEEEDTPDLIPEAFLSTAPSVPRNERQSRGHGVLSFTKDLSKAFVHVAIENVKPEDIAMFHIHCGRPGQLGPIIIDFGLAGDLQKYWADNIFTLELTNADIEAAVNHGHGIVAAFTAGCPIIQAVPIDKVKTIGGIEFIARQGELYFNLHTKGQTFFGDIRGQLHQVER